MARRGRLSLLLPALLLLCGGARALDYTETEVHRSQWPEFVNSSNIAALPQVRQVLQRFDESGRFRIIVRHPGGEAGAAWAEVLVSWFVAHGVPGEFIDRELGTGDPDRLLLLLVADH